MANNISRRRFSQGAIGLAIGGLAAAPLTVAAQGATPGATTVTPPTTGTIMSPGYVSLRIRALKEASLRADVNQRVVSQFVPAIQALTGYEGYILGDVIDQPAQSLSVVVLTGQAETTAFDAEAKTFIASLPADEVPTTPTTAEGVLWIAAGASAGMGTPGMASPAATPAPAPLHSGYAAVRLYASAPGVDPRTSLPLTISGLLPILRGIQGFQAYLWFANQGTIGALSLFDSEAAATASTTAATNWAQANVAKYFTGTPTVINANLVYADLPVLATHAS